MERRRQTGKGASGAEEQQGCELFVSSVSFLPHISSLRAGGASNPETPMSNEIMAGNSPNLMKDMNVNIQEIQ